MKLLKKILKLLAVLFVVFVTVSTTTCFWFFRRFCDLDSPLYSPSAETVVRLTIDRSFLPPLSYTIIRTKSATTLEACVRPDPYFFTFCYFTRSLSDQQWKRIIDLVERSDVPSMTHMKQQLYLDGSTWNIGIARNGSIEKASVRCPDASENDTRKTNLVALGKLLNEYAWYITATEILAEPKRDPSNYLPTPTQAPTATSAKELR